MSKNQISKSIAPSITAEIEGDLETIEGPLFAINWFNTRVAFVYHLYNFLAGGRALSVGAKVLFKGKCGETISGDDAWSRKFLLIVNYPSGHQFLKLLSDRFFQMVSVFRMAAVRDFSFVLDQRIGEPQLLESFRSRFDASKSYSVLHFSLPESATPQERFSELKEIAEDHDCEIFFAGSAAGKVVLISKTKGRSPMPFITDCTALIRSNTEELHSKLWQSESMRDFLNRTEHHFAAHVVRNM